MTPTEQLSTTLFLKEAVGLGWLKGLFGGNKGELVSKLRSALGHGAGEAAEAAETIPGVKSTGWGDRFKSLMGSDQRGSALGLAGLTGGAALGLGDLGGSYLRGKNDEGNYAGIWTAGQQYGAANAQNSYANSGFLDKLLGTINMRNPVQPAAPIGWDPKYLSQIEAMRQALKNH